MEKIFNDSLIEEMLSIRLPISNNFEKCSFILPNGKYLKMYEHYEAYKFLVVEGLSQCIPDAEQLLSDLGYIRYSWIGYLTLPDKKINSTQYKSLENVLINISKYRDSISIQIHSKPKFYMNFELNDVPNIIRKIKRYYATGNLLP